MHTLFFLHQSDGSIHGMTLAAWIARAENPDHNRPLAHLEELSPLELHESIEVAPWTWER